MRTLAAGVSIVIALAGCSSNDAPAEATGGSGGSPPLTDSGAAAGPGDTGAGESPSQPDTGVADATVGDATVRTDAGDATTSRTVTFTPAVITADTEDLPNPLRGQYRWLGVAPYPAGSTDTDSYQRYNWNDFEPTRQAYNWALIDKEIQAAKSRRGRFGMRIMPLCQGCANHTYQGADSSIPDDLAAVSNPLIAAAPGETKRYVLPDWNSEAYLTRVQEMIGAIAARYKDDPTFAWFDVSSYGNWGEFHLWPFSQSAGSYSTSTQKPITDANARRLVQMNAVAFANKLLVINSEQRAALAEAVATKSPPVGIRVDCLGADGLGGGEDPINAVAGAADRWRTAPFITEWCQYNIGGSSANLFIQGFDQVKKFHISMLSSGNFSSPPAAGAEATAFRSANAISGYRLRAAEVTITISAGAVDVAIQWVNDNVAPTYLAWRVVLVLRGPVTVELSMAFDLRNVIDAPVTAAERLPIQLPAGTYQALLRVEDVQAVSLPMQLAMQGRDADGNYLLGPLDVPTP